MDLDVLKSFLEINRTRHFGKAADNLYVSQSAISARIRLLEEALGTPVFTRTRNNIQLTPAGRKLLKYAENIINTWNRARQEISVQDETQTSLSLAGVPSIWDIFLQGCLTRLLEQNHNLSLSAEAHSQDALMRNLLDGSLDIAFMYESPQLSQLIAQKVSSIPLIMVSTERGLSVDNALERDYIFVDWGTSFSVSHARMLGEHLPPSLRVGLGRIAKAYILQKGGTAYLARPMIEEELRKKKLFLVKNAPVIDRDAYAVYPSQSEKRAIIESLIQQVLAMQHEKS